MIIDWKQAPDWADYWVYCQINKTGYWCEYAPKRCIRGWDTSRLKLVAPDFGYRGDWRESLVERTDANILTILDQEISKLDVSKDVSRVVVKLQQYIRKLSDYVVSNSKTDLIVFDGLVSLNNLVKFKNALIIDSDGGKLLVCLGGSKNAIECVVTKNTKSVSYWEHTVGNVLEMRECCALLCEEIDERLSMF